MNIDIVNFFPHKIDYDKKTLSGTIRIIFKEIGLEILGIHVEKKERYRVRMPFVRTFDREAKKAVSFPLCVFKNKESHSNFMVRLKFLVEIYLNERYFPAEELESKPVKARFK